MFSPIVSNSIFFIDILIVGIFFLVIGLGMGMIIFYYSTKDYPKKKYKIRVEKMLLLYVDSVILVLLITIILLFYTRGWIL